MTTFAPAHRARLTVAATASLTAFSAAALGAGLGRGLVTTYLPVLLDDIRDAPGLIGTVMLVNTASGFVVPLGLGLWSDRLHRRGRSRTGPFILGGSLLTAGGLVAIALGHASTYLFLALAAAVAYTGLNAVTTAHRDVRGGRPRRGHRRRGVRAARRDRRRRARGRIPARRGHVDAVRVRRDRPSAARGPDLPADAWTRAAGPHA